MITHGSAVIDAFHSKFLLYRQRDRRQSARVDGLSTTVALRQAELERKPHRIEYHDALVCDLVRLSATIYEDVQREKEHRSALTSSARIEQDAACANLLSISGHYVSQAYDHLDAMPALAFGSESALRIAALMSGLGHNMAVVLLERGMVAEGRSAAKLSLDTLRGARAESSSIEELATTIEPLLMVLAS